ncbi:MAG: hypothetical protein P0S94_03890, partial [Simkaniaceae bacterium]|nr:hypothetical protein [Simkaniaceae bacterium]
MKKLALAAALAITLYADETPFSIQLNDPEYSGGIIRTQEGGVVKGGGVRIQAQKIDYKKKVEDGELVRTVVAEGDLVVDYHGRIFVGQRLEYDFVTGKGTIENAVASVGAWFVGGDKITLNDDGSVQVFNAYITASTNKQREWDIYSSMMKIDKESEISSRGVQVRVARAPVFWIPAFRANLKTISDHPVRYSLSWDRGQGPQLSMRYRLYSWEDFNLYGRFDYRWKRGPGGAIEADYASPDGRTKLKSKNFYAYDTFWNDNDPNKREKRFRLQGIYHSETVSKNTTFDLTYDKISDRNMPGDFRSDEFELNTAMRTQVALKHNTQHYMAGVNVRPRINYFQGFKQELPTIHMATKPFVFPKTGAILDNRLRLSFLDYDYSSEVQGLIPDFSSMRGQIHEELYRPFNLNGLIITPFAGFDGIVYSNSPNEESITQAIFAYGARGYATFAHTFNQGTHTITPYAEYKGLSRPIHDEDEYFIFGIGDGFHRLNLLRFGVKNDYALKSASPGKPTLTTDL